MHKASHISPFHYLEVHFYIVGYGSLLKCTSDSWVPLRVWHVLWGKKKLRKISLHLYVSANHWFYNSGLFILELLCMQRALYSGGPQRSTLYLVFMSLSDMPCNIEILLLDQYSPSTSSEFPPEVLVSFLSAISRMVKETFIRIQL